MSHRKQFLSSVGAQGYSQGVTIVTQLVTIPLLIATWGTESFGAWIALTSIANYLSLADLGMGTVAANAMTIKFAEGDWAGVKRTHSTSAAVILGSAFLFLAMLIAVAVLVPLASIFNLSSITEFDASMTFALVGISAAISLGFGVSGAAMRATGRYWLIVTTNATNRLITMLMIGAIAFWGGNLVDAALASVALSIVMLGGASVWIYLKEPWLFPKLELIDKIEAKFLVVPSLSYMLFYLNNLLSIQGVNMVVSATLGPSSIVVVQAIRTLTRMGRMLVAMAVHSVEPIFARLSGQKDETNKSRAFRSIFLATLIVSGCYMIAVIALGPWFLNIWTLGVVVGQKPLLILMAMAVFIETLWFALQMPFTATNRHSQFAYFLIFSSLTALVALIVLAPWAGLISVGATMLAANASVLLFTIYKLRKLKI